MFIQVRYAARNARRLSIKTPIAAAKWENGKYAEAELTVLKYAVIRLSEYLGTHAV